MKTFEEAMLATVVRITRQEAAEAADETCDRYGSLFQEIGEHPLALRFVTAIANSPNLADVLEEDFALSVLVSIFANGVMIGMEMEKPD